MLKVTTKVKTNIKRKSPQLMSVIFFVLLGFINGYLTMGFSINDFGLSFLTIYGEFILAILCFVFVYGGSPKAIVTKIAKVAFFIVYRIAFVYIFSTKPFCPNDC